MAADTDPAGSVASPADGASPDAAAAAAAAVADRAAVLASARERQKAESVVRRGTHLILRDSEGTQKVFSLGQSTKDLRMGRYPAIPVEAVLGMPYGVTLRRSEGGQWIRQPRCPQESGAAALPSGEGAADAEEVYESNRHLAQDNSAQALSPAEVSELKGRCSGEEVVEALASNSATFATKTKFAQEKYLKKKQQKHVQQVTLLRPSVMELCETYMKQSRNKICGLRFDYLSSILCQADVRPGGRYLVLDSACSLIVGAMAQQMAGLGEVHRVYRGGYPEKSLQELDLGPWRATVWPLPVEVLQSSDPWSHEWLRQPADGIGADGDAVVAASEEERARIASRQERARTRRQHMTDLEARPVDALIVVAGDEDADLVVEVLELGLPRLASGGRLVVYGQHLQPLAARQGALRASGDFVDVRLHQLFTREYQVLPMRTHPIMTADAMLCEGFILSATKIVDENGVDSAGGNCEADGEQASNKKRRRRS